MSKYSIDKKAEEYLGIYAEFEQELAILNSLFDDTVLTKTLEEIGDLVEEAYEINQEIGFLPEDGKTFSDIEKFALQVRFDPEGLQVRGLKDVPSRQKKEFDMPEEEFQCWMKEEREALETAFVDMEDLIDSIEDSFRVPDELEELEHIINESLDPLDPTYKVLDRLSMNLTSRWEELISSAKTLVCLSLDVNEDVDRAALPAMLYDP
ncbi:hypothetical protein [Halomonas sp. QHL1]|uniref:hypothetical protein n=1 Tax=Halomonas sp. QHL1 TaxID=1123773 RepID=UPI0008FD3CA9|nr:hypothetical protein [Halomonas sp. QHL1]OJA07237.1 hypothetical protein QHL1GM_18495 [Halomonas sp. QHL1]